MIALLPTLLADDANNELALILLPLNSLITDYKRKLKAMEIPFDTYPFGNKKKISVYSKFLLLSVDSATSKQWPELIHSLKEQFHICRLIIDEAHIPLISTDYRKIMEFLHLLRIIPMQLVLLTATSPPSHLSQLLKLFGMEQSSTAIIRGLTDRPELEYIRMPVYSQRPQALKKLEEIIQDYRMTYHNNTEARAMVFVPFRDVGENVAKILDCDFYHSGDNDTQTNAAPNYRQQEINKENMYNNWFKGTKADGTPSSDIIVATTALSAGNDYPSVRLIVHFHTPYEMISYVQEVSRGGRDGQSTKCIIIPTRKKLPVIQSTERDYKGLQKMHEHVFDEADCLRFSITGYCDGYGVFCSDNPMGQKCSLCASKKIGQRKKNCGGNQTLPQFTVSTPTVSFKARPANDMSLSSIFIELSKAANSRKKALYSKKLTYVETINKSLAIFNASCACCVIFDASNHHQLPSCPKMKPHWDQYRTWKQNLKYPPKSSLQICFYCHVPIISEFLHEEYGDKTKCRYPDVVPVIAYFVFLNTDLRKQAESFFSRSWPTMQIYVQWLVSPIPFKSDQSHLLAVSLWYTNVNFGT